VDRSNLAQYGTQWRAVANR